MTTTTSPASQTVALTTEAQCHALALLGKQYALDTIQLTQAGRSVDSYYAAIETGRVADRIIALRSQQVTP